MLTDNIYAIIMKILSDVSILDNIRDPRPNRKGFYAMNVINEIRLSARRRNKEWHITDMFVYKCITGICRYCKFSSDWPHHRIGIDRMDSSLGYIEKNCVPCCKPCNDAKGDLTVAQFYAKVSAMHHNYVLDDTGYGKN